jgi:hypothetical protein
MDNELTNTEINNILKNYKRFKGCYTKDKINEEMIEPKCYYVVNLESSEDGNGTHWCALYCFDKKLIFWFDPMGFVPPDEIASQFNYYYNDVPIQDFDSTSCGYYCIMFIKYTYSCKNFLDSVDNFIKLFNASDLKKNNIKLEKLLNKFMDLHLKVVFE